MITLRWDGGTIDECDTIDEARQQAIRGLEAEQERTLDASERVTIETAADADDLQAATIAIVRAWALAQGRRDFAGHGNYFVPAETDCGGPAITEVKK